MAEATDRKKQMDELVAKLESGVKEVFESGRYTEWLNIMAKFHNYSWRNTILIKMQRPDATRVAGFNNWKELGRSVNKGEHGIQIFAPAPYKRTIEVTNDEHGDPLPEPQQKEIEKLVFKPTYVFDISQTNGRELPELANRLTGEVKDYDVIFAALKEIAPYPISFEPIEGGANGYCSHREQKIVIREGVSQEQAVKTAIHEIAHGIMHTPDKERDPVMEEVQAESVAYIVCQHLGVDSSQYTFGYVAGWASDKELKVLQNSLADIQVTANKLIQSLEPEIQHQRELAKAKALKGPEMLPTEILLQKSVPVPPAAELSMSNDALAKQMAQNGFKQMESKGQLSDFLVFRDKEINDFLTFYDWKMVAKFASEHRTVTADSRDIRVEGLTGSWRAIDSIEIYGREYFMLQHEQHGSAYPNVIVDNKGYPMTGLTLDGWQKFRENIESLYENWGMQTNEPESYEYLEDCYPGEQRLAQIWDEGYEQGMARMAKEILEIEKRIKERAAVEDKQVKEPPKRNISDRLADAKKECDRINAGRQVSERNDRDILR